MADPNNYFDYLESHPNLHDSIAMRSTASVKNFVSLANVADPDAVVARGAIVA